MGAFPQPHHRTNISYKRNRNSAQLLQTTAKYNEALLKHEQNEIDSLAKYIKEIEAVEKNPYEEDFKSESERETLSAAKRKLEDVFEESERVLREGVGRVGRRRVAITDEVQSSRRGVRKVRAGGVGGVRRGK